MARFYLHLRNGCGLSEDTEGQELPDLAAARQQAIDGIRSILGEEVRHGAIDFAGYVEIADADGNILLTVPFREAVDLHPGDQA